MQQWRVSGFREVRELGHGGQGRVVLAVHEESGAPVAIKYLPAQADDEARSGFRHEARMLGQVTSPHVARLYRLVEGEHGTAIVMEAVDGTPLKAVLARHGALAPEAALAVLKGSLLGLAAAHAVGVVHRDYKPANVIVPADGRSKLIDFGIATPTGAASAAGTPYYMAPEQWRREPATPATDVYAATCVFYECITGRRPYDATDRMALMAMHGTAPIPAEDVPEPLRPLVEQGMAKSAEERPPGAAAFVEELEQAARAAYGTDWEARGVRTLAAAAVALAALFPLAAAGLTAPAAGLAAGAGGAAGVAGAGGAAGTGLLVGTGAKVAAAIAATAVVGTTVTGGVLYAGRDETEPATLNVSAQTRTYSQAFPDIAMRVDQAEYVTVSGHPDRTVQQRINQALRAPLDQAVADYRQHWAQTDPQARGNLPGTPMRLTVKVRYGSRGPGLMSVRYLIGNPVFAGGGTSLRAKSVNLVLATGRVLKESDIFQGAALANGAALLSRRVPPPPPLRSGGSLACPFTPISGLGRIGGAAAVAPTFTPDRMEFTWTSSELCFGDRTRSVPYAQLTDLLDPEVVRLARGG
ncbi:serine/threonine protein kinase [Thermomonospora echinospora]|uniref:non-specific serine/threonine protein kinase n=1 Tax=Thermomonospora echinospora TaxID=1992 RepID=A0A1H5X474_9ACTN|nr:serine/threonine-protein kinase [Thermomonospora echinospora]SEG06619.1 serine/threonine protein kinase [Thermomonospora echinospora]